MNEPLGGLQDRTFARATAATAISYPPERRLSAAQLASYLDRRTFAVVGSTRADGRPHAAMSVYIRRGTAFWLPTMAGSVRERNRQLGQRLDPPDGRAPAVLRGRKRLALATVNRLKPRTTSRRPAWGPGHTRADDLRRTALA